MKWMTQKAAGLPWLIALALILLALMPTGAQAQDAPKIRSAVYVKDKDTGERYIGVGFRPTFKSEYEAQVLNSSYYRLSRISAGRSGNDRFLGIRKVTIDPIESPGPNGRSSVRIYLDAPDDIAAGETYTLYYLGQRGADDKLKFADKEINGPLVSIVQVDPNAVTRSPVPINPGTPPSADPGDHPPDPSLSRLQIPATPSAVGDKKHSPPGKGFALKAAKGRDDANLYFAGDINRASGTDFTGSVDMKVQIPIVNTATHTVLPRFDLKASNDPKADPDSLKAGVDWDWVVGETGLELPEHGPLAGIIWRNSGGLESNRDFDNKNLVWSSLALFRLKNLWFSRSRGDTAFAVITPQLGAELGKNLDSPVREAEGRGVARLVAGSFLYVRLYQGETAFARITLDGLYQRRWPLRSEVGFRDIMVKDAAGKDVKKTVPEFFGKRPREWADVKLNYNLTEYFGLYVGYQYGQLPPAYKLVNHAFKFGLVFKAKLK